MKILSTKQGRFNRRQAGVAWFVPIILSALASSQGKQSGIAQGAGSAGTSGMGTDNGSTDAAAGGASMAAGAAAGGMGGMASLIGGASQAGGAAGAASSGMNVGSLLKQGASSAIANAPQGGGWGGPLAQDMSWMNDVSAQPAAQPLFSNQNPDFLAQLRLQKGLYNG